ncbi:hypothetical protein ACWEQL_00305 [Kitasatospora sp. NPDC004240]
MTATHPLPGQWTIRIKPVLNLLTLTLTDDTGTARQHGYHMGQVPVPDTIHSLDEITDNHLRATAQAMIDDYFTRLAEVHKAADAFTEAIPDWSDLTARLRTTVPDCRIETDLDSEALALRMTLTATGPAAGQLLTLLATWPASDGLHRELDDDGTLTAVLDQPRAISFLAWFRDQR